MTKSFPAKIEQLGSVCAFLEEQLEALSCPMKVVSTSTMALEEMFVNVANYAYPDGNGTVDVELHAENTPRSCSITLTDCGIPFNPLSKEEPDTSLPAEAREIGGLGILMTRKLMDECSYERKDGKNVFTMKKFF